MKVFITGIAGFIGFQLARALLGRGARVVGVDNIGDYYDPALKQCRLALLDVRAADGTFGFRRLDIADGTALAEAVRVEAPDVVVHLAAQAGVRASIDNPFAYGQANLIGQLSVLEAVRHATSVKATFYAFSSSIYGSNPGPQFSETERTDSQVSLYGATKKAGEAMAASYSTLYGLSLTSLRFFTVYGPWGRPDMAYWTFTRDILAGTPIRVFNKGEMKRDFTYVDDIVEVIVRMVEAAAASPPSGHRIYNLGNNRPEKLGDFIACIERLTGREAIKIFEPMQPGDVPATWADTTAVARDFGFSPSTRLEVGLERFISWYRDHYGA